MSKNGHDPEAPWRCEKLLYELYTRRGMTTIEIAEQLDCSARVVSNWLYRHDIEIRERGRNRPKPWRDEHTLYELYVEEGLSMSDVAQKLGCCSDTIRMWLNKHDIKTRSRNRANLIKGVHLATRSNGYVEWEHAYRGERYHMRVHRLLAVAEFGFDEVADKVVHHRNHIPWDNRIDNLELMTLSEHSTYHNNMRYDNAERH